MGGGDLVYPTNVFKVHELTPSNVQNLKKSWHVSTGKNIERVRRREQEVLEEKRKLEILRKELAEERVREDLRMVQEQSGLLVRKRRLDWMYEGNMHQHKDIEEEHATTETTTTETESIPGTVLTSSDIKREEASKKAGAMRDTRAPISISKVKDLEEKIALDPLTEIKRRELERYEEILRNPYELAKLKGVKFLEMSEYIPTLFYQKRKRAKDDSHRSSRHTKRSRDGRYQGEPRRDERTSERRDKPSVDDLIRMHKDRHKYRRMVSDSRGMERSRLNNRLSQMKEDAGHVSKSRERRILSAREKDRREEDETKRDMIRSRENPEFLSRTREESVDSISLSERIGRRSARNIILEKT